ncbi:translation initiation factor IF-2-like [Phodopus roborovskii]|uniref:translation initiation factor IF-2-like n=1 Tax=Phodopus roborovskii TaxID=109678 RepID=UPI0021E42808|nr:translation initiation factor IF-2-like [Phodopus roborovskii]
MEPPRRAAAPAPARASAGASRAATPAASGPPRPRQAPSRPHPRGRPFPAERAPRREIRVLSETAVRGRPRRRHRTTFPTRGCVTGRHVRGRRGSSRPARERRPRAQSAALRPAERTTPSPPSRPASQRLAGRSGLRTRPGLAGIRPVARGPRGGGPARRPPRERCPPSATWSSPSHQRHSNILRV